MTHVNGLQADTGAIADEARVLITISCSEAEGMIRRWGTVSSAIGDLSVQALVRGAIADEVVELLREQRPHQHAGERAVIGKLREILDSGHRIFVRDSEHPIDSARADQVKARSVLGRGSPEYQAESLYVLHLTIEPFGAALPAAQGDDAGAAAARDALRRDMGLTPPAPPASVGAPAPAFDASDIGDGHHLGAGAQPADDHERACEKWAAAAVEDTEPPPEPAIVAPAAPDTTTPPPISPQASPKKYATKAAALTEQFRSKIEGLNFRGLFVGNFGFQRDTVVDVAKLSALSPQTISAYLMKANSLRQSGEHEKALSYYRVLLKSDPDNADYRFLYGKTLAEMGRVEPARECFERARALGHENAILELEQLERRQERKPALAFLQFWRRAEG